MLTLNEFLQQNHTFITAKYIAAEPEAEGMERMMERSTRIICKKFHETAAKIACKVVMILLLCISLAACSFSREKDVLEAPSLKEIPEIKFYTFDVTKGEIKKEIRDSVKIEPATQTPIFSKYGGWLITNNAKQNEFVKKGDLLIEFNSDSLEIEIKKQEVALEKVKLNAGQVLKQINQEIELAIIDLEKTEEKLSKQENLRNNLLKDNNDFDVRSIEEQIEELKTQIVRKKINLEGIKDKYQLTDARLKIDIENSEIQLNKIEAQLDNTKLYAPKDGMIFYVDKIVEGEYASAYRSLLTIISIEDIQLKYTGINANKYEVGMDVTFILDKEQLQGEVISAPSYYSKDAPASVKETVIMSIEGLTVEKLQGLKSDISVRLVLEHREDVVVIPKNVLNNHIGNKYVYVIENGMKKQRFVETGIENNIDTEIVKGLEPGDKVVDS